MSRCEKSGGCLTIIGETVLGYGIPMLTKGSGEEKILLIGGTHAREHIASNLLFELFERYKGDYRIDCVPVLNIDGVLLARNGLNALPLRMRDREYLLKLNKSRDFSLWKANIRGVDINVNFDAGWGEGKENVMCPGPESYIGKYPGSEPETRAVEKLLNKKDYALAVSYHSKGEEVYFGFRDDNRYREQAERFSKYLSYQLKETPGSAGGIKDYWTKTTGRLGLTVEVGSDSFPHPYPESELDNLIKRHEGSLELLTEIGKELWINYTS